MLLIIEGGSIYYLPYNIAHSIIFVHIQQFSYYLLLIYMVVESSAGKVREVPARHSISILKVKFEQLLFTIS